MAKLFSHQVQYITETDRSGATPAQFLPSTMLSWRAPIMARDFEPARKPAIFDDKIIAPSQEPCRPAP